MLTPKQRDLNLVIMGDQQVAFDAVCCAILGLDARGIEHIRLAEEHGFGTTDLSKIRITGDVTLDERGLDLLLSQDFRKSWFDRQGSVVRLEHPQTRRSIG
jgi:uncharacterized protein (DUF362 family)